jgi:PAS domain S-box-containing protein
MRGGTSAKQKSARTDAGAPLSDPSALKLWFSELFATETVAERLQSTVIAALGESLGLARVVYEDLSPEHAAPVLHSWYRDHPVGAGLEAALRDAPPQDLVRGRALVITDVAADTAVAAQADAIVRSGVRALLAVPLHDGGRMVALLTAADDRPRRWHSDEIGLLAQTAARLWSALRHLSLTARLRDSEQQFRTLAENVPALCWVGDANGAVIWANRQWHDTYDGTGVERGDVSAVVHPADLPLALETWRSMRENASLAHVRLRMRGRDGVYRPYLSRAAPVFDEAGRITRWCGVQLDLTPRESHDERQAFLRAFSDATHDLTHAPTILSLVSDMLIERLGLDLVTYSEVSAADPLHFNVFIARPGQPFEEVPELFRFEQGFEPLLRHYHRGETLVVSDYDDPLPVLTEELVAARRGMDMRAAVTVPLVREGELLATLCVSSARKRTWLSDEIELVEDCAERIWSTVSRARAEEALLERERNQAFLVAWSDRVRGGASTVEATLATTLQMIGEHLGVSRATFSRADGSGRIFTISGEWTDGSTPSIAGTSFSLDDVGRQVDREWSAGEVVRYHDVTNDPRIAPDEVPPYVAAEILAFVSVPLIEHDRVCSALSIQSAQPRRWRESETVLLRELAERLWVTLERARAQAELHERERAQALLIDWSDRVRAETDPNAILELTLDLLGSHLGLHRVTYAESDTAARVFTVTHEWRNGVHSNLGRSVALGGVDAKVDSEWLSGDIVCYHDVATDPRVSAAALAHYEAASIRAFVSVPLIRGDAMRSILSLQSAVAREWASAEIALMRDIAERTWAALDRAKAQSALLERERQQAFLLEWNDRVRHEASPSAIMKVTLEWLGRHLDVSRVTYAESEDQQWFTVVDEWRDDVVSVLGNRFALPSVGTETARAWSSGELVRYDDTQTDPRLEPFARDRYRETEIGALVSLPLIRDDQRGSALSVQSRVSRTWRESEIALIREIAERTWIAIERAKAQAALHERERHQAFLIDWSDRLRSETSPDLILATTLELLGLHLGVSRANFAQITSSVEGFEVLREWRRGTGAIPDSPRDGLSDGLLDTYLAGEVVIVRDVHTDPRFDAAARDGYQAVEAAAFLGIPLSRGGRVRAVLSVQQDSARAWRDVEIQLLRDVAERTWVMLDRARAQAALEARERDQAFIISWTDAVRHEADARAILARTLDMLVDHMSVSRANYSEPSRDGNELCVLQESCQNVPPLLGRAVSMTELGEQLAAAHRSGHPVRIDSIYTDPRCGEIDQAAFSKVGLVSVLTMPMIRAGEIVAMLSVHHATPRSWTDAEVELVRDIADRTLSVLERAQSEQRLAESEAQLSAFMENAPVAMHLKDADGRYIRINPTFANSVGISREELQGMHASELFPPAMVEQIKRLEARALAGETVSEEIDVTGLNANFTTIQTIFFPITGSGAARTAGFTLDLTERKRAEAALQRSREALYQTEKLSALGSLLAGVSHELNNPLSIVVAQAVMMERQARGTELAERAQKIRKAADRCARIVQTFLAMARQKRPEREPVDLNAVATAAHELADYGLRTEGVRVVRDLAPELPLIAADSDQLHQIIINLIMNAQQAMVDADVPDRTLTLRTRASSDGTVQLDVEDNGPGIPEEVGRRIFEPFFTTKPQGQGTGVGLSFSQGLAEAHGGKLELVRVDRGACFRLTLPVGQHARLPQALGELASPETNQGRRALVVDDEAEIAESLADFLSFEGFACEIALGGEEARSRLANGSYDLIVSDLRMPDLDGPSLHAWIMAERPELADRMGFATGDTLGVSAARFLERVRRPVLEKPFMPDAVRRFLQQMDLA